MKCTSFLIIAAAASKTVLAAPTMKRATLADASHAADVLRSKYYSSSTGLYGDLWWNSGTIMTTMATLASIDDGLKAQLEGDIANTLKAAPNRGDTDGGGFISSGRVAKSAGSGFINGFFDDEGWWAMAWITAFDLTGNANYLNVAQDIFQDMTTGKSTPCGGIWWDKAHTYVAAIANELFLNVAAALANRVPSRKDEYVRWAVDEWNWISSVGLINSDSLINDGLDMKTCKNNGYTAWTYNQGVVLGGLVELNKAAPNPAYLSKATDIALATISKLVTSNGILKDDFGAGDTNAGQFKGIFVRNLAILQKAAPNSQFVDFLKRNADSIQNNDREASTGLLGPHWEGPYESANPASHSSALDCLVAAAQF